MVFIKTKLTNSGIQITASLDPFDPEERLQRNPATDQARPKNCYVYAHLTKADVPFYIGKGKGRRAWDGDRHYFWHRYVQKRLKGEYSVVILDDGIPEDRVDAVESDWIAQEAETLVNWINAGRKTDFDAIALFHRLRGENRARLQAGRDVEDADIDEAIRLYRGCVDAVYAYASIQYEGGLLGELIDEEREEFGMSGDIYMIDRLTVALKKAKRIDEARDAASRYFAKYKRDLDHSVATNIRKRLGIEHLLPTECREWACW
jgi:hypothetical protein